MCFDIEKGVIPVRKLMNRKGFSLVELMIVVVIMGILIAVAIPLYGAIKDNANNKTCAKNIKSIKSNAANYMASYDHKIEAIDELKDMYDDGKMPVCPLAMDDYENYLVAIQDNGSAVIACSVVLSGSEPNHTAAKTGSLNHTPTASDGDVLSY